MATENTGEMSPEELAQMEQTGDNKSGDKSDFGDELETDSNDAGDGKESKGAAVSGEEEETEGDAGESEEGEGEGDGDGSGTDDGKGKEKPGPRVPYSRFKSVIERANGAQRRVAELERQIQALKGDNKGPSEVDKLDQKLDGLYEKVEEARTMGKTQEAAKLQREIDRTNREIAAAEARTQAKQEVLGELRTESYNAFVETIEEKFPELDPDSEHYDEAVTTELLELASAFQMRGMTEVAALKRAMAYVYQDEEVIKSGTAHLYKEKPVDKKVEKPKDDGKKEKVAAERKNVQGRVAAAGRTPPRTEDAGRNNTADPKLDVTKMTDAEYAALPESTRARMRGDYL